MKKNLIYLLILVFGFACDDASFNAITDQGNFETSKGGSTARFAIKESILYVVDDQRLKVFDISKENESRLLSNEQAGWGIETIFPFGDLLFLGMQSGVLIYDISSPARPQFISEYMHIVSCDPVVTDGRYAYLTLRTGTNCGLPVNELQILDLSNISNPLLINTFQMTNPKGLAIHEGTLFVCDDGIKVLDVSNVFDIRLVDHIPDIPANDVIFHRNQLLVTADDGFYQFDAAQFAQISYYAF